MALGTRTSDKVRPARCPNENTRGVTDGDALSPAARACLRALEELSAWPHAALVIEAQYADFGNPDRIGRWPAAHLLRVLGELPVLFPRVQCVFAGNRKLANVWTQRWFAAVHAALQQPRLPQVAEAVARYRAGPADGGLDARIRLAALREHFCDIRVVRWFPGDGCAAVR